jgi:glycosyltransferase involved in cell wall biosynthesis
VRIALVYDCIYPQVQGGVEHRNYQLARSLAARGHEVALVGWAAGAGEPAPGVEILPLPDPGGRHSRAGRRRPADALAFAGAVWDLPLARFDLVETANIPYAHLLPLAWRCARAGRPLVVTWHEVWGRYWRDYLRSPAWPLFALAELACAQLARVTVAVSPLTAERLAARRRRGSVLLVPNGVAVEAVRAAAAGQPAGPPLIFAGRLLADKRVDLLLRAVALLPRQETSWLTVVGDGPEREPLDRLAAELGLGEAVRFLGRLETPEQVWAQLGGATVAVQPSRREGFGLFPLEAMAAGLPVVYCTSPSSAVGQVVRDGIEGLAAPPEPAALAARLVQVLTDGAARERLGAAARRRAEEHDWREVAARLEAVFVEVVGDATSRGAHRPS